MWRCFHASELHYLHVQICSTHVEMFLSSVSRFILAVHLLHACGDVSDLARKAMSELRSAPRMWRCFYAADVSTPHSSYGISQASAPRMWRCFSEGPVEEREATICSTHVEMFLVTRLPMVVMARSAPHMWRCFSIRNFFRSHWKICSTHVEMFLLGGHTMATKTNLLHACGDVSRAP